MRVRSTGYRAMSVSRSAAIKPTSSMAPPGAKPVYHPRGSPVPFGATRMKPSLSAFTSNPVRCVTLCALPPRPWSSTTRGRLVSAPAGIRTVNGDANVLRRCIELERHDDLGDELRHVRPDEVCTQQRVSGRIGNEFHEAGGFAHGPGAAVRRKRKLSGAVLSAALFHFLLGETH